MTNSPVRDVFVVAGDPGGANLVAAWCAQNASKYSMHYSLEGPAVSLFENALGKIDNRPLRELTALDPSSSFLLCGTSRDPRQCVDAIQLSRSVGMCSAAYLDHWANYWLRFGGEAQGPQNLPDEIWVTDSYAEQIAVDSGFPAVRIKVKGNPYIDKQVERARALAPASRPDKPRVLFLSEPVAQYLAEAGKPEDLYGYDEYTLLKDVATAVGSDGELVVRLHPAEPADKYDALLSTLPRGERRVSPSAATELAYDLSTASLAIGSNSTALVVAFAAGLPTASYIPRGGTECVLPHSEIAKIRSLDVLKDFLSEHLNDYAGVRRGD